MRSFVAVSVGLIALGLAVSPNASAAGEQISYVVASDGPLLSVSFYDGMNEMRSLSDLGTSSWSASFVGQATYQLAALSAQTNGTRVTCRIVKDGSVVDEQTTVGRYTMSVCAG
jgi:Mycobacterium membrane protein